MLEWVSGKKEGGKTNKWNQPVTGAKWTFIFTWSQSVKHFTWQSFRNHWNDFSLREFSFLGTPESTNNILPTVTLTKSQFTSNSTWFSWAPVLRFHKDKDANQCYNCTKQDFPKDTGNSSFLEVKCLKFSSHLYRLWIAYISVCMYNNNVWQSAVWFHFFKLLRVSEKSSPQTPKPLYHEVNVYAHNPSSSNLTARFHPLSLKQSN